MTTSLSEIRTELLKQHRGLRALLHRTKKAAVRCKQGESTAAGELRQAITQLAGALRLHNQCEEEMLGGIIPTLDAWGPARAEAMSESHVREHFAVHAALVDAGRMMNPQAVAAAALRLIDQLKHHMAREEEDFLRADLLQDGVGVSDGFCS